MCHYALYGHIEMVLVIKRTEPLLVMSVYLPSSPWYPPHRPQNLTKMFPSYNASEGYEIVGFGWFQGWNDGCSQTLVDEYEVNLVNLVTDLRREWKNPTLAVSIPVSGFNGWAQDNERRLGIINAQFNAANATRHPELHGHIVAEETRSYWRGPQYSPVPSQGYHWFHNAESYFLIGKAMGVGMLKMIK
eukprot:m.362448 g.362448  ORF g.362448 m.362448 type:complete len:189 (+) comp20787_c0_seq7:1061-1627(+)